MWVWWDFTARLRADMTGRPNWDNKHSKVIMSEILKPKKKGPSSCIFLIWWPCASFKEFLHACALAIRNHKTTNNYKYKHLRNEVTDAEAPLWKKTVASERTLVVLHVWTLRDNSTELQALSQKVWWECEAPSHLLPVVLFFVCLFFKLELCPTLTPLPLHPLPTTTTTSGEDKGRWAGPLRRGSEIVDAAMMKTSLILLLCALTTFCGEPHRVSYRVLIFSHSNDHRLLRVSCLMMMLSLFPPCSRWEAAGEQRGDQRWRWGGRGSDRGDGRGNNGPWWRTISHTMRTNRS